MKWSKLYQLKGGWEIDQWDIDCDYIFMYNKIWGLEKKIKLPQLLKTIIRWAYHKGKRDNQKNFQEALGFVESQNKQIER